MLPGSSFLRFFILLTLICIINYPSSLAAQQTIVKKLEIGELWHSDEDIPSGGWQVSYNWPGNVYRERGTDRQNNETQKWLANGTARMCGLSCGFVNWKDQNNSNIPFVVYSVSQSIIEYTGNVYGGTNVEMKVVFRREPPKVTVNNVSNPPRHLYDEIDPSLISDAKMLIRWSTKIGLTFEQTFYAYSTANAENYLIVDFRAIHNGNTDQNEKDSPELDNQVLKGVYFNYGIQPILGYQGAEQNEAIWEGNSDDWVEYYGETYQKYIGSGSPLFPEGDPSADSLRVFIAWDGDNNKAPFHLNDDTGDPSTGSTWLEPPILNGALLSPQYFGMGILHADTNPKNTTNDLSQPATTVWYPALMGEGRDPEFSYNLFFKGNGSVINENWHSHRPSPKELGFIKANDPLNVARPNPYISIGPYDMPFGSDIHWTMLVAVNGLSSEKAGQTGHLWWRKKQGEKGITTEEKNRLVATGRDSLLKVFGKANRRYFSNIQKNRPAFDVPDGPPAPDLSIATSETSVKLTWSDVSNIPDNDTGEQDFAGYRVYRAEQINYGPYRKIWECGGNTGNPVKRTFTDTLVSSGIKYFYYVSAFDDGSQNWEEPGLSIESGKYMNMVHRDAPVVLNISKPFEIDLNNNIMQRCFYVSREDGNLVFKNISDECEIKIFSLDGQAVTVINAVNNGDASKWDFTDTDKNPVADGLFLYKYTKDDLVYTGKFILF